MQNDNKYDKNDIQNQLSKFTQMMVCDLNIEYYHILFLNIMKNLNEEKKFKLKFTFFNNLFKLVAH